MTPAERHVAMQGRSARFALDVIDAAGRIGLSAAEYRAALAELLYRDLDRARWESPRRPRRRGDHHWWVRERLTGWRRNRWTFREVKP